MSTDVIAVVENDQGCLRALRRLLVARGYGVEAYRSAEEFLAATPASEAGCVLIDIHLGAGLSGLDLACRIRSRERPVPFLLMTASIDAAFRERAIEAGCVAFLEKPIADGALWAALDRALNMGR
jgi:FixJ family two-component response regulator